MIIKQILYGELTTLRLADGYKILTVQYQNDKMCVWVDNPDFGPDQVERISHDVHLQIVGTGYESPPFGSYVGTVQNKHFVWHVFATEIT